MAKTGVPTNVIIQVPKKKRIKCDCTKCSQRLKTNVLCKLGRNTNQITFCKWYDGPLVDRIISKKPDGIKPKTMEEISNTLIRNLSPQAKDQRERYLKEQAKAKAKHEKRAGKSKE